MSHCAVAGDHDQRIGDDGVDRLLRVGEDQHGLLRAGIVQFLEALFGEVLAGVGQDEIAVIDAQFFAPSGIEQRGIHRRHAGDVGIRLGGHVESARARAFDQRNAFERVEQAGAVDVNDVQRRAGDRGCADDFLDGLNGRTGLEASEAAHVRIDRQLALRGHAEHVDHFESGRARCVLNAHADAECAGVEFVAQALLYLLDLLGRCWFIRCRSALGQDLGNAGTRVNHARIQRCTEDQRPRRGMAGGCAVVDQRVPFLGREKLSDVGRADFHFQRRGHAVERLHALALDLLAVLMQIDEAGSDDQSRRVDDAAAGEWFGGDARDLSVADADVAYGVEAGLGVHDAAAFEDEVVLLGGQESWEQQESEAENQIAH